METIDSQIAKMEARFVTDRDQWTQETKISEERQNEKLRHIKEKYENNIRDLLSVCSDSSRAL